MTIIEFAKIAGVSKSTVSRYFNNGYVSEEATEKIKEAIEKTGFKPQRQAQSMRTKKTNIIGVILPKISTETAPRVVEGISDQLRKSNYDTLIANTNLDTKKEIEYLKMFKNQVDGIIFMATKVTEEHLKVMDAIEIPIVVVAQNIDSYPSVYYDDFNAAKDVVNLLIKNNLREIGFIGVYEEDISVGKERKLGYLKALEEAEIEKKEKFIKIGDFSPESGYQLMKELIEEEIKPRAIFTVTDNLAFGAIQCLKDKGYRVPEDISIVSIGDSKVGRYIEPKLTTVHYPFKGAGIKAAEIILDLINTGATSSKFINKDEKLDYYIVSRDSVI